MPAKCLADKALPEAEVGDQCLPLRYGGKKPFLYECPPVEGGHHEGGLEKGFFAKQVRHLNLSRHKKGSRVKRELVKKKKEGDEVDTLGIQIKERHDVQQSSS